MFKLPLMTSTELSKVKFASEITFLFCLFPKGFFPFAFSAWQYAAYNQKRLNPFPFCYTLETDISLILDISRVS